MQTIYDHKLFEELKQNQGWETLWNNDQPKNPNIPVLTGGIDHISKSKKYFTFHDIGCNGRDHSFRIGDQPLYVVCYSSNQFGTPYHLYTEADVMREARFPSKALTKEELIELYRTGKYRFVSNPARCMGIKQQTITQVLGDFSE